MINRKQSNALLDLDWLNGNWNIPTLNQFFAQIISDDIYVKSINAVTFISFAMCNSKTT